jgi:hypothetical protein
MTSGILSLSGFEFSEMLSGFEFSEMKSKQKATRSQPLVHDRTFYYKISILIDSTWSGPDIQIFIQVNRYVPVS